MPSNKKNKPLDDIDDDDDVPLRTDDEEEWEDFDDEEEEWIDDLDDGDDDEEFDSDDEVPGGSSRTKFPKNNKPEADLYAVLGLTKQATQEEIAKSYRRQALKFHPDRNPEGAETFKKLTAAYEVLSDANARKRYDRTGQVGDGAGDVDIDEVSRSREIQDMLEHFMNAFRYSEDEVEELKKAFVEGRGLLEATLDNFPWTNDEGELERIVELVNTHIIDNNSNGDTATSSSKDAGGAIVSIDEKFKATWKKSATPSKVQSLSKKLDKERKEAEAILAEILAARHGDDNNNNNNKKKNKNKKNPMMITAGKNTSGSASSSASTSARQPKNAAASSSSSSTAVAKGSSSSTQLMLPSLASLRENAKKSFFDNIADLEAKYGGTKNGGGGGSSNKKAKKETKRK